MTLRATLLTLLSLLLSLSAVAKEENFRSRASTSVVGSTSTFTEDVAAEIEFGRDVAARILGRYRLLEEEQLNRYVNLVGRSVALHGNRSDIEYHFAVLDTDSVNAYAAPGGYIFVTRGAIAHMHDEAELAAVLAHEVAHVNQKHIVRELSIRGAEKAPEAGLSHLLSGATDPARVAFSQAVDKAVAMLFESGLKRDDEFEADYVGTLIVANTGYDPSALRRYLERLKAEEGEHMAVLNNTHPPFDQRLVKLDQLMTDEHFREGAPTAQQRFTTNVKTK